MIIWYDSDISFLRQLKTQFSATFFIDYDLLLCFERFRERSQNALCNSTGDLDSCIGWPSKDAGTGREKFASNLGYLGMHVVKKYQVTSSCIKFIKLISGGGSRPSSKAWCQVVTLMNGWSWKWTKPIFSQHTSQASWAKCEQSEKLARKEILQKLNVTMQKRVSKAESSKAKIYNARCKNSKTSWNWEFVSIQRIQRILMIWCRMSYVLPCVACVAMSGSGPGACQSGWCREPSCRDRTLRSQKRCFQRCLEYEIVRSTEESLTHLKTRRLDEFLSCRTYGQRSSRKCYEGIQCTRPCRCDRHLTARNSIMTCISMY